MRIERVKAHAFGPLHDEVLEFGEGLTVVVGPNEAGKSSWHAATRLALTGIRRGPGMPKGLRELIERHRPWDAPDYWEVEARLHLADGRAVDIRQDLGGKVACRARDVVLGDDLSSEIINDGTPDATRWLGLDRDSFASVAAVSQAQILAVAEDAGALQEHMQRAAATLGTDATAAEAIERLKEFRREAVGADTVAARGPLRSAMRELEAAEAALAEARRMHAEYLEREARLEEAERVHHAARRIQAGVEAARARSEAADLADRVELAVRLAERHPRQPAALAERDVQADAVAAALAGWRSRSVPTPMEGETLAELEARLAALPALPDGDRSPDPTVTEAARALDRADGARLAHGERPSVGPAPAPAPPGVADARWLMVVGAALALGGVALVVLAGQPIPGLALAAAGMALAAWAWLRSAGAGQAAAEARAAAAGAAGLLAEWEEAAHRLEAERAAAETGLRAALRARGAPAEGPAAEALAAYLRACAERSAVAQRVAGADDLRRALEARRALEQRASEAAAALAQSEERLREVARGVELAADGSPDEVVARLEAWQQQRAATARAAEEGIREWQQLQGLLAGRSLDELRAEALHRAEIASRLAAARGDEPPSLAGADHDAEEERARAATATARAAVDTLSGELRLLAGRMPDVVEAEERVAVATAELARVRELASVLDETTELLQAAERRVHLDIAPVLKASVEARLGMITGGAYDEVGVNPRDLSVEVREVRSGQWRDARLLSEGTREQVYLLLRVAMAEHLVKPGETAPLLLDEVTAQADPQRKRQVLDALHALSADRQVILFSHDAEVADWASTCLDPARDRLVRLGGW
jgi:DNA repair exonuclease SbcCD ATPase subunit